MRQKTWLLTAGMTLLAARTQAQESLCDPCVDPPLDRTYPSWTRPTRTVAPGEIEIITGDDLRQLGVISVADMVNQLELEVSADDGEPEPPAETESTEEDSAADQE